MRTVHRYVLDTDITNVGDNVVIALLGERQHRNFTYPSLQVIISGVSQDAQVIMFEAEDAIPTIWLLQDDGEHVMRFRVCGPGSAELTGQHVASCRCQCHHIAWHLFDITEAS